MSADMESTKNEQYPHEVVAVSVGEILSNPAQTAGTWHDAIERDPNLLEQIEVRAKYAQNIAEALDCLPNPATAIEKAYAEKQINERQTEKLYTSLAQLLADKDYQRLVLYLPFELLPPSSWHPNDFYVEDAIERFTYAYLEAWQNLLTTLDARANFVDGDVLETELRSEDLPRVVKAAHMAPKLVEREMLTILDVVHMYEAASDPILKQNLADSLQVLNAMGYLSSEDLQALGLHALETAMLDNTQVTITSIANNFAKLSQKQADSLDTIDATPNRKTWLKRKMLDDAVTAHATHVADGILSGNISRDALQEALPFGVDMLASQVLIEAVQSAVERAAQLDNTTAIKMLESYMADILMLWESADSATKERIIKMLRRSHKLGLVSEQQLAELDIELPALAGPLSKNLELMPEVLATVENMTSIIETNPYLSAFLYPVISIGGSRLKGYGEQTSDIDLCVFIKPGVSYSTRRDMRAYIDEFFASNGQDTEPIEFWLDDADGALSVRDIAHSDMLVAESNWTHILFDTVLVGPREATKEFIEKLMPTYFDAQKTDASGRLVRELYIERIEQNLLQYRLLHKGYARHYPVTAAFNTAAAQLIDGDSVFWDSGYRALATRLYASRVFLPKTEA